MTTKERNDLKNQVTKAGGRTSAYDDNVQFLNGVKITHGIDNVTLFDGKPCYGSSSASNSVKGTK